MKKKITQHRFCLIRRIVVAFMLLLGGIFSYQMAFAAGDSAPVPKNPLPTVTLRNVSEKSLTGDLIAEDKEKDELSITKIVTLPESSIANSVLTDGTVTIRAKALGKTQIQVVVSDGVNETEITVSIQVFPALSVYEGNILKKEFIFAELESIAFSEGDISYQFSGYNNFPTVKNYKNQKGPTIQGILNAAYKRDVIMEKKDNISFVAPDRYTVDFTADKLFGTERFYYPNLPNAEDAVWSFGGSETTKKGGVIVPAMISLEDGGSLRYGQAAPLEQNSPGFNSGMASGGKIIVARNKAKQNPYKIEKASKQNGAIVGLGEKISFLEPAVSGMAKLYYTISTDGIEPEDPTLWNSHLVNISSFNRGHPIADNLPVIESTGTTIIKVCYLMNSYEDGNVATFTYEALDFKNEVSLLDKIKTKPASNELILRKNDSSRLQVILPKGLKKIQSKAEFNNKNQVKIMFRSTKKSVASVSGNGKIVAKKQGKATIQTIATLADGSQRTISTKITVKKH